MSRPKKPVGTHLAITAIRMPPQIKIKLEAISHQTGLAQQEHIRRALDAYFDVLIAEGKFNPRSVRPADAKRLGRPPVKARPEPIPTTPARRVFRRPSGAAA
jgi:hypothetical protein